MGFLSDEGGGIGPGWFNIGLSCFQGNVDAAGTFAVTYTPDLTFSGVGTVRQGGDLAVTYTPVLTFAATGTVDVSGTLAVTYTPSLTFAATGSVGADLAVTGTLAATYTPDLTFAGTGVSVIADLVITSFGPQAANLDVPATYTIDADKPVEFVIFDAASANPAASDFNTGATTGYIDLGPITLTQAGTNIPLDLPATLSGSYKIAGLPLGGGDADVAVSTATAIATTSISGTLAVTYTPNLTLAATGTSGAGGSVTDDFNRTDEELEASANWTDDAGSAFAVVGNLCRTSSQFGGAVAYTGSTLGSANQFASYVFKAATSASAENQVGVVIRSIVSGGFVSGYWLRHDHAAGTLAITRLDEGTGSVLASVAYTASADDVLRLEISGTSLTARVNGTSTLTTTDATYSTIGRVRLFSYQDGASDVYDLDDFTQGTL